MSDADSQVKLAAAPRSDFGKGASRRLRRDGSIPAVIYGPRTELLHVSLNAHDLGQALRKARVVLDLDVAGKSYLVAPRDIQRDVVRQIIEHVDLVVIDRAEAHARALAAEAIARAEAAAEEAGVEVSTAVEAIELAIAEGRDPDEAAATALAEAKVAAVAAADAGAAAEAAEEAESAEGESAKAAEA
ncbi:MAG: 50S ribosomal protein L25 [Candidatus Nanopelagicales bacterium]